MQAYIDTYTYIHVHRGTQKHALIRIIILYRPTHAYAFSYIDA